MSAPDTNIDKQAKRHKGPLFGIGAGVAVALALLMVLLVWTVSQADEDEAEVSTPATVISE